MLRGMVQRGDAQRADDHAQVPRGDGFCDEVTVLRHGKLTGAGARRDLTPDAMAEMMMGTARSPTRPPATRAGTAGAPRLEHRPT